MSTRIRVAPDTRLHLHAQERSYFASHSEMQLLQARHSAIASLTRAARIPMLPSATWRLEPTLRRSMTSGEFGEIQQVLGGYGPAQEMEAYNARGATTHAASQGALLASGGGGQPRAASVASGYAYYEGPPSPQGPSRAPPSRPHHLDEHDVDAEADAATYLKETQWSSLQSADDSDAASSPTRDGSSYVAETVDIMIEQILAGFEGQEL